MNRQFVKIIGAGGLAILVICLLAQTWVLGQVKGNEQNLVGSWDLQVTLRDCDTGIPFVTFLGMETFNQGGTMQQTAIPDPGLTALPGHGIWSHQTGRSYSSAFQSFGLNPNPALTARLIVRSAINLGLDGDSYTSTDTAEVRNLNGDVVARACSTTTATRFQ